MAVVESVRGPVDLGSLGQTLMHEHVFVLSTEHMQNYGSTGGTRRRGSPTPSPS